MLKIKDLIVVKYATQVSSFAAAAATGFFLTGTRVAGISSFADISLSGAVDLPYSAAVFTGSLIRSIIGGNIGHNIVKLSALAMILIIKMFLEPKNDPKLCGINTAVSIFVSGAAVSAVIGELMYKLLFYGFYSSLAGFTAYSASKLILSIRRQHTINLTGMNGFSCAVVYIMLIASLSAVKLPMLNAGIIVSAAVTLTGAYFYRHNGGVFVGALSVCGAFLSSSAVGLNIVLLPAAGLLTGYLYKQKRHIAAAGFVGINFVMTVLTGMSVRGAENMIDIILGVVLFIPFAGAFSDKWIRIGHESTEALPDVIGTRMSFLSDTVRELRKESERISDMLSGKSDISHEIEENSEKVCSLCYRRPFCWKSDRGNTYRGFTRLAEMTEFASESFPVELAECLRKGELMDAFARSAREKASAKLMEMRFSESREMLHEQLRITEELIRAAGERLDVRYSENVSRIIKHKLEKFGIASENVIACYNSRSRLLAEIYFSAEEAPESSTRICDLISDELHILLESTEPVRSGKEIRIRVYEKPEYKMEVYAVSAGADNSGDNGDTHTVFFDGREAGYAVLSDGMGTGRAASMESRMVVGLFRRLVTGGVGFTSAVKLVNSVMVTKSWEESFATLDAVRIDLDECTLTVIKSGATATLIRHHGNVLKITSPTFPIGIYETSEVFVRNCEFEEGDIVIMFSDGISENAYPFIKELLLGGDDLKHIVDEISRKAQVFNPSIHSDDVTVIGVRVTR